VAPVPIRAVTFDFWNTIAAEPARGAMKEARHAAVLAACRSLGLEHDAERIGTTVQEVIRDREAAWAEGIHLSPAEGAERLADALELEAEERATVAEAFLGAGRGVELTLAPKIRPTLERLAGEGLALGIVCDAGFTGGAILRAFLADQGLLGHFSGWGFSDEVGTYKPAPEIFAAALGMLGAEPADAVHVGDLRRTDIAGARAFGMRSIRYRGLADDPGPGPEADLVIDDHRELPGLLASIDS
jgi:putative hydrolase of the HAD superfamily